MVKGKQSHSSLNTEYLLFFFRYCNLNPPFIVLIEPRCLFLAFSANGKDVIVDFPQQSHWTGLLSEMELVPSVHPGVR